MAVVGIAVELIAGWAIAAVGSQSTSPSPGEVRHLKRTMWGDELKASFHWPEGPREAIGSDSNEQELSPEPPFVEGVALLARAGPKATPSRD
jgi:hypothetical protein